MKQTIVFILVLSFCSVASSQQTIQLNKRWQFCKAGSNKWYDAKVPGTVHTDLLSNKLIPDPFYRDNEAEVQWLGETGWVYKNVFDVSPQFFAQKNIEIIFDGLDTYAEVKLNGVNLISADNMFRQWKASIKNVLKRKGNVLVVHFLSPVNVAKAAKMFEVIPHPDNERIYARKAQYQFGWDWAPRLVTVGIWKAVTLVGWHKIKIEGVHANVNGDSLETVLNIRSDTAGKFILLTKWNNDTAGIRFNPPDRVLSESLRLKNGYNEVRFRGDLREWIGDVDSLGILNDITISITDSLKLFSSSHSEHTFRFGKRDVRLVTQKDSIGESFYFTVNGKPTFIKGANWIPPDNFLPRAKKLKRYEQLIKAAKEANINMLRVWGGGIYEDDVFYELCDRYGIMVWQDFMFAGALYPADAAFLKNVEEEVRYQVKRLRHHPSIVLWCGNNEMEEAWFNWGWQKQFNYSEEDSLKLWNDYKKIFHELIPKILNELDPQRPYWPSSPSLGWGRDSAYKKGDVHYWGVWWGKEPVEKYNEKVGRFVSEYGMQGMPDMKTIKQFSLPQDWDTSSAVMRTHQKHPFGWENIKYYIEQKFRMPKSFEDLVYVSQLMQADAIKTAIEAHRRNKPTTMGTMFWQWNDCWPVTSWSAIDYYGRKKAMYYEVKRSYSDVAILPYYQPGQRGEKTCAICDTEIQDSLTLEVYYFDFKKNKLYNRYRSFGFNPAEQPFGCFFAGDVPREVDTTVYRFRVLHNGKEITSNYLIPIPPKDLPLRKAIIQCRVKATTMELTADTFAYGVYIDLPDGVELEDNYFHLMPNEKKVIRFTSAIPLEKIRKQIKIKSLVDTY